MSKSECQIKSEIPARLRMDEVQAGGRMSKDFVIRHSSFVIGSRYRGFTLLELLISVSIFLMITVIALANFRTGEQMERLRFSAENVQQQIRELQTFARTGQAFRGQVPKGGYGLSLTICNAPCAASVFADQNANGRSDGSLENVAQVRLSERITVMRIAGTSGDLTNYPVTLIAHSPYGELTAADGVGNAIATDEVRITFRHADINRTRTLIVNVKSGQMRQE